MGCRVGASRLPSRPPPPEADPAGVELIVLLVLCVNAYPPTGASRSGSRRKTQTQVFCELETGSAERIQRLLEAVGMRAFGLGKRLEPVGDLAETFVARLLGHARVHIGVLVRLAGDRGLEIQLRLTDRESGGGITHGLEVLEMAVRVPCFTFGGGAEHGGD